MSEPQISDRERALLDRSWMEAENYIDIFWELGSKPDTFEFGPKARDLIRKACTMVALECEARQKDRENNE